MKRFSQLAMLIILAACLSNCDKEDPQPYIPDNNFLKALIEAGVDTDEDGTISLEEASAVTSLILVRKEISDLTGISKFVNLEELLCYSNDLTTLDVSNNTALLRLVCYDNQLTNLDISKCTSLTSLNCSFNKLDRAK